MDILEILLDKIDAPLGFVSANDYERLPLVSHMGKGMAFLIGQLRSCLQQQPFACKSAEYDEVTLKLSRLFLGFDSLALDQKKERISIAQQYIQQIRAILSQVPRSQQHLDQTLERQRQGEGNLNRSVQVLKGVGPRMTALLSRKNLHSIRDLLFYLPHRYEDRRVVSRIDEIETGGKWTVMGTIAGAEMRVYGRRRIFEVTVNDGHDTLKAKWFKGREAFLRETFKPGRRLILTGTTRPSPLGRETIHPDFEIVDDHEDQLLNFKRIVPIYSETEGLTQKWIRRLLWQVVRDHASLMQSPIPDALCRKRLLLDINEAIRQVHFPDSDENIAAYQEMRSAAHKRLIYEELFIFQLRLAMQRRQELHRQGITFRPGGELLRKFCKALPFVLTAAQERVIQEIERDMTASAPMNRLLQGDVGSGKTIVAMAAMVIACESGYQAAMMAPTEILAAQHYRHLKGWADKLGLKIQLLTGSCKLIQKHELLASLKNGEIDIIVGTHALLQEGVLFRKLGIVIIDEQHRFGVVQRAALRGKGEGPDVLVMTATPIPRTLAMTVYGDLDVSVIDELPPDRIAVSTKVFTESQRGRVYDLIRKEINKGQQAFLVYPLVEESEALDLRDAIGMAEHLRSEVFPDLHVGLIHGRMKTNEKDRAMDDFISRKTQILVATTVIEVGIDIPSASLMVIEHAERFGLSQLHQLRGRIGRSDTPSICILMTHQGRSVEARRRLAVMETTNDGFRIAEEDLVLRGPGEFLGTRQSGLPEFKIANIARDLTILSEAREDAFCLVAHDPQLSSEGHSLLKEEMGKRGMCRQNLAHIG